MSREFSVRVSRVVSIGLLVAVLSAFDTGGGKNTARFESFSFAANGTSSLNIGCTGNAPTFANAKLYTPQIVLSRSMDVDRTLAFAVMEDRSFASDPTLALFTVGIRAGDRSPSSMATPANAGADVTPPGTPNPETQGFWLTCTTGCKVRGNAGRGDDDHARVYLKLLDLQPASSSVIDFRGNLQSGRRTVRCN